MKEIKKELSNLLNHKIKFRCYADGMFTFTMKLENVIHEINISAENSIIFRNETVKELLEIEHITFFEHSIYIIDQDGNTEKLGGRVYNQKQLN